MDPKDVMAAALLAEVLQSNFEGVSGVVTFKENGDRSAEYELMNNQIVERRLTESNSVVAATLVHAATYNAESGTIRMTLAADGRDTSEPGPLYWVGGYYGSSVPPDLISCEPGFEWDEAVGHCTACPNGWRSEGGYRSKCSACPPGTTSTLQSASTDCNECANGTFSSFGGENCTSCQMGTFGALAGQSACDSCPVGRYSNVTGLTECHRCGEGLGQSVALWTTMSEVEVNGVVEYSYWSGSLSEERCGCDRGAREDASGECVPCTEGMVCRGMNAVTIEEGYFSMEDLSIYRCHGGDYVRCKGGLPGSTCAEGRTGITCSECLDAMTPGENGTCKACGGGDTGPFVTVLLLVLVGLVATYHLIDTQNRVTQSHSLLLCAIAVSQLLTATQQLGVVGMLSVDWEEPVSSLMKLLGLLTFNIEVLRLNCVSTMDPVTRYVGKVSIIFLTIGLMFLIHVGFVVVKYKCQFRARTPSLIGCMGTLFMVFYISVTSTVLEPLQCEEHPNEAWTIAGYQGIRCWDSEEHTTMLIIGIFAFFAVPVAYLCAVAFVVKQFPRRMKAGDASFLKAFAFIFFRYK
eukprot:2362629-Amphidinium_carterae.1